MWLGETAMVAGPFRVEDVDQIVVEFGLVGLSAGAISAFACGGSSTR